MANPELKFFYNSRKWKLSQQYKLATVNYRCEKCGGIAEGIHHKIPITLENVHDYNITLNQDNLVALCKDCHNKEHKRFKKSPIQFDEEGNLNPYLLYGEKKGR
jgi:5-methylcytosine-specific restriction endonuclease McrA